MAFVVIGLIAAGALWIAGHRQTAKPTGAAPSATNLGPALARRDTVSGAERIVIAAHPELAGWTVSQK